MWSKINEFDSAEDAVGRFEYAIEMNHWSVSDRVIAVGDYGDYFVFKNGRVITQGKESLAKSSSDSDYYRGIFDTQTMDLIQKGVLHPLESSIYETLNKILKDLKVNDELEELVERFGDSEETD
jgi:hypothetical protein